MDTCQSPLVFVQHLCYTCRVQCYKIMQLSPPLVESVEPHINCQFRIHGNYWQLTSSFISGDAQVHGREEQPVHGKCLRAFILLLCSGCYTLKSPGF